jgi:hypothetical protein
MAEEFSLTPIPLISTYKINVYTGTQLHATITVFSIQKAEELIKYYTDKGYTAEIVE